jgi:hypothetical protein
VRAAFVIDGMVKEIAYDLAYTYDEPHRSRGPPSRATT